MTIFTSLVLLFQSSPIISLYYSTTYTAGVVSCNSSTNHCNGTAADNNMKGDAGTNTILGLSGDDRMMIE
jgi:hypothetical protein